MRFSPRKIIWLFLSSVLILNLTGFGCAIGADSEVSVEDPGSVNREFEKLSGLSRSIRSIEDEEYKQDLSVISAAKRDYLRRKTKEEDSPKIQASVGQSTVTRLDALEKTLAESQKNINLAVLWCGELAQYFSDRKEMVNRQIMDVMNAIKPLQMEYWVALCKIRENTGWIDGDFNLLSNLEVSDDFISQQKSGKGILSQLTEKHRKLEELEYKKVQFEEQELVDKIRFFANTPHLPHQSGPFI